MTTFSAARLLPDSRWTRAGARAVTDTTVRKDAPRLGVSLVVAHACGAEIRPAAIRGGAVDCPLLVEKILELLDDEVRRGLLIHLYTSLLPVEKDMLLCVALFT